MIGFAFYSIPVSTLLGSHLLWEDGICLVKAAQGKGYSFKAIEQVVHIFPDRQVSWIACRTQNPALVKRYSRLGRTFPFNELYDTDDGKKIMNFLLNNFDEIQAANQAGKLNQTTGICTEIYPQGKLGDYPVNFDSFIIIEKQLEDWVFCREKGDAIIIVSSLEADK